MSGLRFYLNEDKYDSLQKYSYINILCIGNKNVYYKCIGNTDIYRFI